MIWERSSLNSLFSSFFQSYFHRPWLLAPICYETTQTKIGLLGMAALRRMQCTKRTRIIPCSGTVVSAPVVLRKPIFNDRWCVRRCILRLSFLVLKYHRNDPLWKWESLCIARIFYLYIVYQLHRPAVCIKWSIQSHCGWFAWRGLLIVRVGLISFFTLTTCMWFPAYSLLDTCMHTRYIIRPLCPLFLPFMHLWTKTSVNTLKYSHIPSFCLIFFPLFNHTMSFHLPRMDTLWTH